MSTGADDDRGPPRDAHLHTALQHAPDAALGAPAHVSAQVIAAGYRAAAEPARPPVTAPPRRAWRLGASGAFATIALAGVLGLLWRGDPPSPLKEATPASASARVADISAAPAAVTADRAVQAEAAARPPSPPPSPSPTAAAPADRPAAPVKATVEEPGAAPWRAAEAPPSREAAADTLPAAALRARVAAPPAPAPAPAPAPLAAAAPLAAPASPTLLSPSNGTARAMRAAPRPSAPWMDATVAGAAVLWRVDGQLRTPSSSWFYALAEQTQGRWVPATETPRADERALQWWEGDVLQGRLWLGPERVLWCDPTPRCEVARLDEGVGPVLLKALGP